MVKNSTMEKLRMVLPLKGHDGQGDTKDQAPEGNLCANILYAKGKLCEGTST